MAEFDPKKILIVLHGSIGDVTRALALVHLLRQGFPKAHIAWSVEPACVPLLEGARAIDEIIVFDRRRPWRSLVPFLARIRAAKFDLVLDLQRLFKSGVVSRLSGAPLRLGFHRRDSKEFNWLFNNLHIDECGERLSKLEHYLKFADFLGVERRAIEWEFSLTAAERSAVAAHLKRVKRSFAVLFAGARWESKRWFSEQIAQCGELLGARFGLDAVLLGAKEDEALARQAIACADGSLVNLVGQTTLREAIGIIQRAKVAIGPDTGLMHIAAAVGTPVVSLWGATDPKRTGPYGFDHLAVQGEASCVPCGLRRCPIGRICMRSISQEQIAAKVERALTEKRADALHGSA